MVVRTDLRRIYEMEPVTLAEFKERLASAHEYIMIDPKDYLREKTNNIGEMKKLIQQARGLLEKVESEEERAFLLGTLGNLHRVCEEPASAIMYLNEFLAYAKKAGSMQKVVVGLIRLGEAIKYDGRQEEALRIFEEALRKSKEKERTYIDFALQHKGKCLIELRRYEEAEACFKEALHLRKEKGDAALIDSTQMAIDFISK